MKNPEPGLVPVDKGTFVRSGFERRTRWLTDPRILFSGLSVLLLVLLWSVSWTMINVRNDTAVRFAESTTRELADIYEAQLVRALREIEQTVLLLDYLVEEGQEAEQLQILSRQNLLPPGLLFRVHILDESGNVLASTQSDGNVTRYSDLEVFQYTAELYISETRFELASGRWWLDFGRGMLDDDGVVAGAVVVSVDAEFFVSAYESDRLGVSGMFGIVGIDGVIRAQGGAGDTEYGGLVPIDALLTALHGTDSGVAVFTYPMDGMRRFTAARDIFGFPLALVIGLSEDEQLAASRADNRVLLWQVAVASAVSILLFGLLGYLGWQLQRSRAAFLAEQLAHARDVEHMAFHDSLTGLPNRSLFSQLLLKGIQAVRRNGRLLAVLFLDLDKFKLVNDTLGHEVGDEMLVEIGRRISGALRASDVVARLGGDEFIVILPDLNDEEQAGHVAGKILAAVCEPYTLAGREWHITVSIGISVFPRDGEDEQTLVRHADVAMYTAKQSGRDRYLFYREGMQGEPGKT